MHNPNPTNSPSGLDTARRKYLDYNLPPEEIPKLRDYVDFVLPAAEGEERVPQPAAILPTIEEITPQNQVSAAPPPAEAAPAAPEPVAGGTIDKDFAEKELLEAADDYQRKEASGFYDRVLMITDPNDGKRWKAAAENFDTREIVLEAESDSETTIIVEPEELIDFPYEYQETEPRFEVRINGGYKNVEAGKSFGWNIAEGDEAGKIAHFTVEAVAFAPNRERNEEDDRVEIKFAGQEDCAYSAADWKRIFQGAEVVEDMGGNLQTPSPEVRLSDVFDRILAGSMQKEIQTFQNGQPDQVQPEGGQIAQVEAPGAVVVPAEVAGEDERIVEDLEVVDPKLAEADRRETAGEEGEPSAPVAAEGAEQVAAEIAPQPPPAANIPAAKTAAEERKAFLDAGQRGNLPAKSQEADQLEKIVMESPIEGVEGLPE